MANEGFGLNKSAETSKCRPCAGRQAAAAVVTQQCVMKPPYGRLSSGGRFNTVSTRGMLFKQTELMPAGFSA